MNSRVKFAEPLRRRRQLLLRVQRMLLRRGSKAETIEKIHSLHGHDKTAVVAVARATRARVTGSRRFPVRRLLRCSTTCVMR